MHTIQKQPDGLYRVVFQWTDSEGRNLYNPIATGYRFENAVCLANYLNGGTGAPFTPSL